MKKVALLTLIMLFVLIALSLHGQDSQGRKWEYLVARGCASSTEANDRVCKISPVPLYHAVSTMTLRNDAPETLVLADFMLDQCLIQ